MYVSIFRYEQVADAVNRKYLSTDAFTHMIHKMVADFFLGKWSGIAKKPNKLQPLR